MGRISDAIATAALSLVSGVVGAGITAYLGYLNTDRGHDLRMVEISLSILRGDTEAEKTEHARRFALRALEKYGKVDIPDDEFEEWVKSGKVPFEAIVGGLEFRFDPRKYSDLVSHLDCSTDAKTGAEYCFTKAPNLPGDRTIIQRGTVPQGRNGSRPGDQEQPSDSGSWQLGPAESGAGSFVPAPDFAQ